MGRHQIRKYAIFSSRVIDKTIAEDNRLIIAWREEEEKSFTGLSQPVNIMTML